MKITLTAPEIEKAAKLYLESTGLKVKALNLVDISDEGITMESTETPRKTRKPRTTKAAVAPKAAAPKKAAARKPKASATTVTKEEKKELTEPAPEETATTDDVIADMEGKGKAKAGKRMFGSVN